MSFTVLDRTFVAVSLALASCVALAKDGPPRMLREPVFGLRIDAANPKLDLLPDEVRDKCSEIANNDQWTGRLWVYARAHDADATYYVVGGYFERHHPDRGESRYWLDTYGGVYRIEGAKCLGVGPAREVFDVRPFDETPQPVLKALADDLASRLARAFAGQDRLRTKMRSHRVDFGTLSPELREAFKAYSGQK